MSEDISTEPSVTEKKVNLFRLFLLLLLLVSFTLATGLWMAQSLSSHFLLEESKSEQAPTSEHAERN